MSNIKSQIYSLLSTLDLPFEDTPRVDRGEYPYALFRLNDKQVIRYKNYKKVVQNFKIDIFSIYPGDKECREWFDAIENLVFTNLMDMEEVVYVSTSGMILDDKEKGPVTKHGVYSIEVVTKEEM